MPHGYCRKHGFGGYELPFDIDLGRCKRDFIGSVLHGAVGGLAWSPVGKGSDQRLR